jgi:hypothetical protein
MPGIVSSGRSRHFQPAHGAGGGGEAVGFDAELLEHGDVEVRQRVVALGVEGEVLAVPEAAADEEDGQVGGDDGSRRPGKGELDQMIVGLLSRNQRPDECECLGLFLAGGGQVVHVLEVEPLFGRGAEVFAEAQRGGGGDALLALDDGGNPAVGQAGVLGEPILCDSQVAERFLERLAGMGVVKEWSGFHGGSVVVSDTNVFGALGTPCECDMIDGLASTHHLFLPAD